MRKHIEGETGDYMLIEKEEKTGRSLTYDDSRRLLILALLIVLGIFAVYTLKHVLLLVAVVFIVGMVFNPVIAWLERRGLRRGLALMVLVLTVFVVVGLIVWLLLPPFVDQVQQLIQQVPEYSTRIYNQAKGWLQLNPVIQEYFNAQSHDLLGAAGSQAGGVAQLLLRSTLGAFGGLIDLLLFFLLLVFALGNPVPIVAACLELVPQNVREPTRRTLARMMAQMSAWARGVLIIGLVTGISTGLLLALIGVQPAFAFGVIAFFGELVPIIGPVIVSIPALFVAASLGLGKLGLALLCILLVQQVETNILIPFVMGREMNLHPLTIMFFTLAMTTIFGFIGAILVVPAAALTKIVVSEFYLRPRGRAPAYCETAAKQLVSGKTDVGET
jgi:predicted PurR-regulated permease PerM